jgi:predicted tellurium resistance membrane protein TerC
MIDQFRYLKVALAVVLMVVGVKMMTHAWLKALLGAHFNLYLLGVVLLILAAGVAASLVAARRDGAALRPGLSGALPSRPRVLAIAPASLRRAASV